MDMNEEMESLQKKKTRLGIQLNYLKVDKQRGASGSSRRNLGHQVMKSPSNEVIKYKAHLEAKEINSFEPTTYHEATLVLKLKSGRWM